MKKRDKILLYTIAIIFAVVLLICCSDLVAGCVMTAGVIPMSIIGNIDEVNDREVAGKSIATRVWLIHVSQIDRSVPFPKANTNREIASLQLKEGEYPHYMEAHTNPTDTSTLEKGDLSVSATNTFGMILGGNSPKLLDFLENYAGGKFLIIHEDFVEDKKILLGSLNYPMVLKSVTRDRGAERVAAEIKFENNAFAQPLIYVGDLSGAAAVTVDGPAVAVGGSGDYKLTGSVVIASVTGITANDVGRVVTFIGSGSASVEESATFILKDGATWSGTPGSKISFKIFDASPTLVEEDGSRIQKL